MLQIFRKFSNRQVLAVPLSTTPRSLGKATPIAGVSPGTPPDEATVPVMATKIASVLPLSVIPAKAGIHPRLQSCNDTETNAILIPGCERGNSHEIFRTQRSEVRNLKSSPSKTPCVAGSALPRRHNFLDVSLRSLRPLRLLNGIQRAGMTGMAILPRYESKSPTPYRLAKACSFSHVDSSTSMPCSSPLCVRRCSISPG